MSSIILIIGVLLLLGIAVKTLSDHTFIPALVGYFILGVALRSTEDALDFLPENGARILEFLGSVGVIFLLFRVGLESDLLGLLGKLRRASVLWACDVTVSGTLGFLSAYYLLSLPLIPSLFAAVALTATSVGIPLSIWRESKAHTSPTGELLVDVAELDDLSGILLMAVLFAVAPVLREGSGEGESSLALIAGQTALWVLFKLCLFTLACVLFSRFLERRITRLVRRWEQPPYPMILVTAIAVIMAALAGLLGFSLAIGAFFAGLVFSRDPSVVKMETSFESIYGLFVPFFFISAGMHVHLASLGGGLSVGGLLLVAAVVGKLSGPGLPACLLLGPRPGALLALSMVPRAEILLIVMSHGLQAGSWAVPDELFSAMVALSAVTCLGAPLVLQPLLRAWKRSL